MSDTSIPFTKTYIKYTDDLYVIKFHRKSIFGEETYYTIGQIDDGSDYRRRALGKFEALTHDRNCQQMCDGKVQPNQISDGKKSPCSFIGLRAGDMDTVKLFIEQYNQEYLQDIDDEIERLKKLKKQMTETVFEELTI